MVALVLAKSAVAAVQWDARQPSDGVSCTEAGRRHRPVSACRAVGCTSLSTPLTFVYQREECQCQCLSKIGKKNRCYVRSGRKAGDTTLGNGRGHGRRCGVAQERAGMVGKSSVPRIALVHLSIAPRGRLHGGSRPWHVPACSQGQRRLARVNGRQLTASRARKFATQADRGAEAQSKTTASGLHSQHSYGYAQSTYWQRAWGGRTGRWTMRSCPPRRSTSTAPHL